MDKWLKTGEKVVYKDRFREMLIRDYTMPDGNEAHFTIFGNHLGTDAGVIVLAIKEDGEIVVERTYRPGFDDISLEIVAGGIDRGEEPLNAAKRELLEETGYSSDEWHYMGAFFIDPYAVQRSHYFVAKNCQKTAEPDLDDSEFIEVLSMAPSEFEGLIIKAATPMSMDIIGGFMLAKAHGLV